MFEFQIVLKKKTREKKRRRKKMCVNFYLNFNLCCAEFQIVLKKTEERREERSSETYSLPSAPQQYSFMAKETEREEKRRYFGEKKKEGYKCRE